jgi:hypothetical protein
MPSFVLQAVADLENDEGTMLAEGYGRVQRRSPLGGSLISRGHVSFHDASNTEIIVNGKTP